MPTRLNQYRIDPDNHRGQTELLRWKVSWASTDPAACIGELWRNNGVYGTSSDDVEFDGMADALDHLAGAVQPS